MNADEKNCPLCGETIKLTAIKCKHCRSMIGGTAEESINSAITTIVKNPPEGELLRDQRKEDCGISEQDSDSGAVTKNSLSRTLLINSGYIATGISGLTIFLIKRDLVTALIASQLLSIIFIIIFLTVYIKDKKSLPINVRNQIAWYRGTLFVLLLPMLAIPLYFRNLRSRGIFQGSVVYVTVGWVLAIAMSVVLAIRVNILIEQELKSILTPDQSQVSSGGNNRGDQDIDREVSPAGSQNQSQVSILSNYPGDQKIDVSKLVGRYWYELVDPSKNTPLSEQFKSSVVRRLPMGGRVQDAFDRYGVEGTFEQYTNQSVVVSRCLPRQCDTDNMHVAISNNGAMGIIIQEDGDCFLYRTSDYSDWKTLSDANATCNRYLSDTIIDQ